MKRFVIRWSLGIAAFAALGIVGLFFPSVAGAAPPVCNCGPDHNCTSKSCTCDECGTFVRFADPPPTPLTEAQIRAIVRDEVQKCVAQAVKDALAAPGVPVTTAAPVVTYYSYPTDSAGACASGSCGSSAPARRGLFGRFRR